MSDPSEPSNTEGQRARAIALWTTFTALLVLGLVLFFRFSGRLVPLLDAVSDR